MARSSAREVPPATRAEAAARQRPLARRLEPFVFLAPPVAFLFLITIYPLGYSVWVSLHRYNLFKIGSWTWVGLENYAFFLTNTEFQGALWRTLLFTFVAVAIEFVLGFAIANLMNVEMRGIAFLRTVFTTPVLLSPVIVGLIWRYMYEPEYGIINYLGRVIGVKLPNWLADTTWSLWAVVATDVWQWTPFVFLVMLAGLHAIPTDLREAAALDGATGWQFTLQVAVPLLRPLILIVVLLRTIDTLKMFDLIYTMTAGGPGNATVTAAFMNYLRAFRFFEMGESAALAFLLLIVINVFVVLFIRSFRVEKAL